MPASMAFTITALLRRLVLDATLAAMAAASPMAKSSHRRTASPGIQLWSEPNFTGTYVHYTAPQIAFGGCYNIVASFPPNTDGGLSSVKVDSDNSCILYPNTVCDPGDGSDNDRLIVWSSYYDLGGPEIGFADDLQSFNCTECTTCN